MKQNTVTSIPELLVDTRGNKIELARRLGVSRKTLDFYLDDTEMKRHCVLNGYLMTIINLKQKAYENKPTLNPDHHYRPRRVKDTNRVKEAKEELRKIWK